MTPCTFTCLAFAAQPGHICLHFSKLLYDFQRQTDIELQCLVVLYQSAAKVGRARFFVVALLFYVHGKHLRSCRDGQLT